MRKQGKYYGPKTPPRQSTVDTLAESVHIVSIDKNVSGGAGLCRVEGQVVFVPESLSGEELKIKLGQSHGGYREAQILEIVHASPFRKEPACPVYNQCGGCDFQYASGEGQLELKKAVFLDALRRQGGCSLETEGLLLQAFAGPSWAYRNRMRFHEVADPTATGPRVGLMARHSNRVVGLSGCPVASPEIQAWLGTASGMSLFPASHVTTASSDTIDEGEPGASTTRVRLPVVGAAGKLSGPGQEARVLVLGKELFFATEGFFQSNVVMLEKLLVWFSERLKPSTAKAEPAAHGLQAVDLYCGCGVFAASLPDEYRRVWAVDNNSINCTYARKNTDADRTTVFEGDVDWWLDSDVPDDLDLVIVDPPRTGLSVKVRKWLLSGKPRRIAYISCNPVTFSRDLKELRAGGYRIRELALFDFYPQTWHIESACIFELEGN